MALHAHTTEQQIDPWPPLPAPEQIGKASLQATARLCMNSCGGVATA